MKTLFQAALACAALLVTGFVGLGILSFVVSHYIISSVLLLGGYATHRALKGKYEDIAVRAIQNYQDRV